jgi:glutaredoxin
MNPRILLLACILAAPAHAGVYKWTDAQGRVHYGDAPPAAAKSTPLRLQTYTGPVQVSRVVGADAGVTLYTTEWCGVCQRAKAFLRHSGVPFREWDVEKTEYGATKYAQLGGTGVPLITVGAEKMTGFDGNRLLAMWKRAQAEP